MAVSPVDRVNRCQALLQWFCMRIFLAAAAAILLAGCSEAPPPTKKAAEPPPAPISGRQAFQYVYGSSRLWASDSQPLTIRSINVADAPSEKGKAGAWEVVFISESNNRARTYTWSAVEAEGLHKGVFPGPQESWRTGGPDRPFSAAQLRVDTPEALEAASKAAAAYIGRPGKRPPVNFLLNYSPASRFTNPVWRVLWGGSVSSAEYTVTVDATTGNVVAHD
jgi:hypothetical protein